MVADSRGGLRCEEVAAGGLEELQHRLVFERGRVGEVDHRLRAGHGLLEALAGDGVDAAVGRGGDGLVAALAQDGDGLRADQAGATDHEDLHGLPSLVEPSPTRDVDFGRHPQAVARWRAADRAGGRDLLDQPTGRRSLVQCRSWWSIRLSSGRWVESPVTARSDRKGGDVRQCGRLVDVASLPPDGDIALEWDAFFASVQRLNAQARIKTLMARGFHKPGDVESRLGYHVGQLGTPGE